MTHRLAVLVILVIGMLSCSKQDTTPLGRYREAIASGLTATERPTTTMLGLTLGMTDQEFWDRCTELNRQQLITMAGGSNQVSHPMPTDLDQPATLMLQPLFTAAQPRRIQALQMDINYDAWSPWNRNAQADSLLPRAAVYFANLLETDLIELDHPQHGHTYASVEGNRLFALWSRDGSVVRGMLTDLSTYSEDPLKLIK